MSMSPEDTAAHTERLHLTARVLAHYGHRRVAMPLAVPATNQAAPIYSGQCVLLGWSIADTSAVANPVLLRQGVDATSQVVAAIDLAANGSETRWLGPNGVLCQGGVFIAPTGTLVGSVYVLPHQG